MKSRSPFAISVLQQDAEGASTTGAQHHHAVNQGKRRGQRKLISWFLADRITELIPSWLGRHFSVREVENQGWSNHTFLVEQGSKDKLIIRLRERRKDNSCALAGYYKEIWAVRQMQGLIPVPGIIESGAGSFGHETEYAYMIQEYLPYPSAAGLFGSHKRIAILEQLGRIARVINSTSTAGFGRTFIPQQQQFLNQSWENFMDCELVSCNFRRLRDKSILGPQVLEHLQARLLEARSWKVRPSLYHLDFLANWNNVLIDGHEQVRGIIDWEFAGSGLGISHELTSALYVLYRDGHSPSEIEQARSAILRGYEISPHDYRLNHESQVEALMIIHAIGGINRCLDLQEQGLLAREPYRRTSAVRAQSLLKKIAAGEYS